VKLQRHDASGWVTIAYATLSSTGAYRFQVPTTAPGSLQFRVYRAADTTHGTSTSTILRLSVT
jgi:hypothetical protein